MRELRRPGTAMTDSRASQPSVQRWRSGAGAEPVLTPGARDDSYLLFLQLRVPDAERLASDGASTRRPAGSLFIQSSNASELPRFAAPSDCLVFHLGKTAFRLAASQLGCALADTFTCTSEQPAIDAVVYALGRSLLPVLNQSAASEFVDYVLSAIVVHVSQRYGQRPPHVAALGLSVSQIELAKKLLRQPQQRATVPEVAAACGVSTSHFSRSFLRRTGLTPHRWQMQSRVDQAKERLRTTSASLTEVAAACGFADQSHFSRVFRVIAGATPGSFREASCQGMAAATHEADSWYARGTRIEARP